MSYTFGMNSQELELENAKSYIKELQMLDLFVKNVPLDTPTMHKTSILIEVAKQMQRSSTIHSNKVLPLWVEFIERANNEYLGITVVHLALLAILKSQHHYKLALKIVEQPGLPIHISIVKYQQYLILCAQVYHEFQRYFEALEMLNMASSMDGQNFQVSFMALKQLILTHKILGNRFDRNEFERDTGKIKVACNRQLQEFQHTNPQKIEEITFEYQIFLRICDQKQLREDEVNYLQLKQLLDLYKKIPNKKINQIKHSIKNEIANSTLYRVKQADIRQTPLHKFENVRDINKIRPVYRSDARNKIMYFIHQYSSQVKLDSMIDKACIMQRIIKNRPVETSRVDEREDGNEDRFGRMGGIGGMGGFGGMMGGLMGLGRR